MRRTTTFAVIALLLTGLTACSPRPADPHPTAEPPTIESPAPGAGSSPAALIPEFVVITAHSVSVGATTQQQIVDVPYTTDPAAAADLLSEALELEPTVSTIAGTGCSAESTVWDWGGLRIIAPAPDGGELGVHFIARATAPETSNGLATEFVYDDTVGTSLAEVLADVEGTTHPVISEDLGGGHAVAMFDGQDGNSWGVIMVVESGIVTSYFAPGYFHSDDGMC